MNRKLIFRRTCYLPEDQVLQKFWLGPIRLLVCIAYYPHEREKDWSRDFMTR